MQSSVQMHSYTEVQFRNEKGEKKKIRLDKKKKPMVCRSHVMRKKKCPLSFRLYRSGMHHVFFLCFSPRLKQNSSAKEEKKKKHEADVEKEKQHYYCCWCYNQKRKKDSGKKLLTFFSKASLFLSQSKRHNKELRTEALQRKKKKKKMTSSFCAYSFAEDFSFFATRFI